MIPKVFFVSLKDKAGIKQRCNAIQKAYDALNAQDVISENELVAIKVHVGEQGNTTHMQPELIKVVVDRIKEKGGLAFLTETSTLYKSQRDNAVKHIMLANSHGFTIEKTGAPFILVDGLIGNFEKEVRIDGELFESVNVAGDIINASSMIVFGHATGHVAAGFGAAVKTLGMGLASRKGKLKQHSSMKLEIVPQTCRFCKKCIKWCPQSAIVEDHKKARIIPDKCIGCGECLVVCRFDSVKFNWSAESGFMQKSMAEHALGAIKNIRDKCCFFNILLDMTKDCDCFGVVQEKIIPDIGILASKDPVAVDKATLDITARIHGRTIGALSFENLDPFIQLTHGAKIGLGSLDYKLEEI